MFYIHQKTCISPQQTFTSIDIDTLHTLTAGKMQAIEPAYEGIPAGMLRRMGKAVKMGVGAAMPLLQNNIPAGIIVATTNGGKEDAVKFMQQIVDYDEGLLTPINFVQSTPNAIAAQIGLLTKNHGYNVTHLQLGLAFEYAMIDAAMMIGENPFNSYLLGAVDDISSINFIYEEKNGCYKKEEIENKNLYAANSPGSIAGEAATMFLVDGNKAGAISKVLAVDTLHSEDENTVAKNLYGFIEKHLPPGEKISLLLTGENGDNRLLKYYASCEAAMDKYVTIARFKHMSGEYPTATAMALWLGCELLQKQHIPKHMVKKDAAGTGLTNVLIYNNYKGVQHSFMLLTAVGMNA